MKAKSLILTMALAAVALAGCGRLGELERPGPGSEAPKSATKDTDRKSTHLNSSH